MSAGFENTSEETMQGLIRNLKSGTFLAIEKMDSAAFEMDMMLLLIFKDEYERRGLNFTEVTGEDLREIIDMWISARE